MIGFLLSSALLMKAALVLLGISFLIYLLAVSTVLMKRLSQGATIIGIRLAIVALFTVICLGFLLVMRILGIELIPIEKTFTNIHVLWGAGWISLLIISVSFQVIPMFHVAPNFSKPVMNFIPLSLFSLLVSLLLIEKSVENIKLTTQLMLTIHCIYAGNLLLILAKRKRKIPDATVKFWQLSAYTLLAITGYFFLPNEWISKTLSTKSALLIGASYIFFFATSVIIGMLLKIMPFLSYTHLQQSCLANFSAMAYLPNMHDFISKQQGNTLFIMHSFTGSCLILTIVCPIINPLLALALFTEFSWLLFLMIKTCRIYQKSHQKMTSLAL